MAITWTITNLDRQVSLNGKSDVVTAVHWRVTDAETVGSGDDEVSIGGKVYGVVGLDTSDLSSFTAYALGCLGNVGCRLRRCVVQYNQLFVQLCLLL